VISILLSPDIYKSLFKKENYKMIIKDLVDIFGNVKKYFMEAKDSFLARFKPES